MPSHQNIPPAFIERFEKIYAETYSKLYAFIKYYVWGEDAIKDALQECYIRLWENMEKVRDDEKIMPMLRTYVMHITIDAVRKKTRELERAGIYHAQQEQNGTADERLNMQEIMRLYREAVAELSPRQRAVFLLHREKGMSHQEISEQLNISTHTVKRHMNEALNKLRTKLPSETISMVLILIQLKNKL